MGEFNSSTEKEVSWPFLMQLGQTAGGDIHEKAMARFDTSRSQIEPKWSGSGRSHDYRFFMNDPARIPQAIFDAVSPLLRPEWVELIVDYTVDETQSDMAASYSVEKDGHLEEVAILLPQVVDELFRVLRDSLPDRATRAFSTCRYRVTRSGSFEAEYFYDKVDWGSLLTRSGWHFPDIATKRTQ